MARGQNLKIEQVTLRELSLPEQNPRAHTPENIEAIKESLRTFGQPEPLLVRKADKTIIHGCGRYRAMRELRWPSCRVVFLEVTEAEALALAVTLNRTGEMAGWDFAELAQLTQDLASEGITLDGLGWTGQELADLSAMTAPELPSGFASPPPTPPTAASRPAGPQRQQGDRRQTSDDSERPVMGRPISVTKEQREVFDLAWERMAEREGDSGPPISQGRCVEFLAAEYLAGR